MALAGDGQDALDQRAVLEMAQGRVGEQGVDRRQPGLIARVLAQPSIGPARTPTAFAGLTPREPEILTLVASGLSDDDIAERLVISPADPAG